MKKKLYILFIGIIIISLSILTACRSDIEVSTSDGILANNNIADFYFYYPPEFTLDKNASMISVYATDDELVATDIPRDDENYHIQVHPNLSASVYGLYDNYESIDEYWRNECLPLFEKTFSSMEMLNDEHLIIDGVDARRYNYTATLAGMEFQYSQIFIIRGDNLYTLTYTATPEKFDRYIRLLDTVAETFAFK